MDITFTPFTPDLAEAYQEYRQDAVTKQYNPLQPSTVESLKERFLKVSSNWADFKNEDINSFFWFVMKDQEIVGTASLGNINRMMLTGEMGYGVYSKFRGKGIATQIVLALTTDAFTYTPLRKLVAFVHEENHASRRVLEKAGYINEGLLREHYLVNGLPVNEIIYGVLERDVKSQSSKILEEKHDF